MVIVGHVNLPKWEFNFQQIARFQFARYLAENGPASALANLPADNRFAIEHPSGAVEVLLDQRDGVVIGAGTLRTARKLFDGLVFA